MSSVVISGDTSGSVAITVPAVAGTNTVTIAAQTGTLNAAGPAFSVYKSATQTLTSATPTKIQFNTEVFDTNDNFNNTTNYRFTPTVAGYYQINGSCLVNFANSNGTLAYCTIYKNGSEFKFGGTATASSINFPRANISTLVYANGTTDYFEIFAGHSVGTSINTANSQSQTFFQAAYVRGA
jgi:hypothetical protein